MTDSTASQAAQDQPVEDTAATKRAWRPPTLAVLGDADTLTAYAGNPGPDKTSSGS
jgi:hypothetical protein